MLGSNRPAAQVLRMPSGGKGAHPQRAIGRWHVRTSPRGSKRRPPSPFTHATTRLLSDGPVKTACAQALARVGFKAVTT